MTVLRAQKQAVIDQTHEPTAGNDFVVVDLELANHTGETLQLLAPVFALRTPSGLQHTGSGMDTDRYKDGCPSESTLAADGIVTCSIAFQVPEEDTFEAIVYAKPDGSASWEAALGSVERPAPTTCSELWTQIGYYSNEDCDALAASCDDTAVCAEEEIAFGDCLLDLPGLPLECGNLTPEFEICGDTYGPWQECN